MDFERRLLGDPVAVGGRVVEHQLQRIGLVLHVRFERQAATASGGTATPSNSTRHFG
jgi:hypothetical protein